MTIGDLGEYKERMIIAKENGDKVSFKKYNKLYVEGYKELTGEDFEIIMRNIETGTSEERE